MVTMTDTLISPESASDKAALRLELRARRRDLNFAEQKLAAQRLCNRLSRRYEFVHATRIAFYFANDGEIATDPLLDAATRLGKQCYVPVVVEKRMYFQRYRPGQQLQLNHFGIPEPVSAKPQLCHPRNLDLILMPLVGFDRQGNRLGMGGGFYDRSLEFLGNGHAQIHRLRLFGLAHACQEVDALASESWDIPLHAIVTDQEFISCRQP